MKVCSVPNCDGRHRCKGYCQKHYWRFLVYGDPLAGRAIRGDAQKFAEEATGYDGEDCLEWPFPLQSAGYGEFSSDGKRLYAHRYVCEIASGAPPSPDHEVAHSCGNRKCVNPGHLRWATSKENHADRVIHGTHLRGNNSPNAKLTIENIKEIFRLKGVMSQDSLALEFGVSQRTIGRVLNRHSWSWLEV